MRTIAILLLLLLHPFNGNAQKHVYDDLLILYVDEEYEKCVRKAERYTDHTETRKDPLPYVYLSMCYFEMSMLEEYQTQDEYRHALRDALKYAERFRKKDKELAYVGNYEDYWMSLNTAAMEQAMNQYEMGEYRKAKRVYDRMTGYMPQNAGAWRMLAICQQRANQERDALVSLKQFDEAYERAGPVDRLAPDQRKLLRISLIKHAEYMIEQGDRTGARELMALGEEDFMSNAEFKGLYNALN